MKVLSFEEFEAYFKRYGRFPRGTYSRKRPPNDREMRTRYDKYVRAEQRSATYRAEKEQPNEVNPAGPRRCSLLVLLDEDDKKVLIMNAGPLLYSLDRAHVFGKNAFSWMRFNVENIVWLNRFSHNCLDNGQNPITGQKIRGDDVRAWWELIIGEDRYARLWEISKRRPL